jgi:acyl dehydratase
VTIAHGFLTLSMLSYLVKSIPQSTPNPYEGVATMINYGLDRVRWPTPVRVNSRIRAHRQLVEADLKDERTIQLKHVVTVELEGSDKPACVAEWLSRVIYA